MMHVSVLNRRGIRRPFRNVLKGLYGFIYKRHNAGDKPHTLTVTQLDETT